MVFLGRIRYQRECGKNFAPQYIESPPSIHSSMLSIFIMHRPQAGRYPDAALAVVSTRIIFSFGVAQNRLNGSIEMLSNPSRKDPETYLLIGKESRECGMICWRVSYVLRLVIGSSGSTCAKFFASLFGTRTGRRVSGRGEVPLFPEPATVTLLRLLY